MHSLFRILSVFLAINIVLGLYIPAIASEKPINCNQLTIASEKIFLEEVRNVGIEPVRGFKSDSIAKWASEGLQSDPNFRYSNYQQPTLISPNTTVVINYIDNFGIGFFATGESSGYNHLYIRTQIRNLAKSLQKRSTNPLYYGIKFSPNPSKKPSKRQCVGAVVFTVPSE